MGLRFEFRRPPVALTTEPCRSPVFLGDYEGLLSSEIQAKRSGWDIWRDGYAFLLYIEYMLLLFFWTQLSRRRVGRRDGKACRRNHSQRMHLSFLNSAACLFLRVGAGIS